MGARQSILTTTTTTVKANPIATAWWSFLCILLAAIVGINAYSIASLNGLVSTSTQPPNSPNIQQDALNVSLYVSIFVLVSLIITCAVYASRDSKDHHSSAFGRRR